MKRSVIISFVITMVIFLINTISVFFFHKLPLGIDFGGGDCVVYLGIGWNLTKIYPLRNALEVVKETPVEINFNPFSLLASFVIIMLVTYFIVRVIDKKKKA